MAIYKANNQIGKLYKGDVQIGKVYKGSTLIYSAEFNAMTDVVWTEYMTHDRFVNTNNASKKEINLPDGSNGDSGFGHMYFPIDLSQYTKMTISCSYDCDWAVSIFGFSTNSNLINYPEADETNIVQLFKSATDSGSLTDQVYDISKYNQKTAYFKMYLYDGSTGNGVTRFTITKLIFE